MLKYFYQGIPLKKWCQDNDYDYITVIKHLYKFQKNNSLETALALTIAYIKENYHHHTTYFYNNMSLIEYCKKNNLNYSTIKSRIRKLQQTSPETELSTIIDQAINDNIDEKTIYYYQGKTLKKYCEDHGLVYNRIYRQIKDLKDPNEINKLINEFITKKDHSPKKERYNINGLNLKAYCKKYNYNYPIIKKYLYKFQKQDKNMPLSNLLEKALLYYLKYYHPTEIYSYQGQKLITYCQENKLDYDYILSFLIKNNYSLENITSTMIEEAIKNYHEYNISKSIKALRTKEEIININEYLKKLHIDKKSFNLVKKYLNNPKDALLFCWYFGQKENNYLSLNQEILVTTLDKITNYYNLSLMELIAIYQCHFYDTRLFIIKKLSKCIHQIIQELNISPKNFLYEELVAVANYTIYEFIENNTSNSSSELSSNLYNYLYTSLKKYYLKYQSIELSFPTSSNNMTNPEFKSDTLSLILTLDILEQKILLLHYEKNLSLKEIAVLLNIDLKTIEEMNNQILAKLKDNTIIRNKIKSYQ